jgi:elongation factor G
MKEYPTAKIRNVVLLGHGRSGKTTLAEACALQSGAIDRFGKISDGSTASDYDPEEIKRLCSINASLLPLEWNGFKINLIDAPGFFDFVGEQISAVRAADAALIVLSGKSGLAVGAQKAVALCKKTKKPMMFFVNKLDDENASFDKIMGDLQTAYGKAVAPFEIPVTEGGKLVFVNAADETAQQYENGKPSAIPVPDAAKDALSGLRDALFEAVAETDEALMEKYFSGETFTPAEIHAGLKAGTVAGDVIPTLCGAAATRDGVAALLDALCEYLPSPEDAAPPAAQDKDGKAVTLSGKAADPVAAQVFKTIADPFIGKLSFLRVYQGTLKADAPLFNPTANAEEKISHIYVMRGKKQIEVTQLVAGDVGAVPKLNAATGDTLCAKANPVTVEPLEFPKPALSMAILPKAKGDEEKISAGAHKLMDEDKTLSMHNNAETHQQILSGVGEQHLEIVVSKLKNKFGVSLDLTEPIVPYREAIRASVKAEGKHKKQSGGHGQYGHVWIEFSPTEEEGLVFEEKVFGGSVPRNYFPAVEKGLRDAMTHGVLAGYPVTGLKATLYDGSYHAVDSSEMAFKTAASLAYKNGLPQAKPVILEPIGELVVNIPDDAMGDVMGDINKRRGRVLSSEPREGGAVAITADVPSAEMAKYATDLRSMTQGRGSFSFEFKNYEQAPEHVAKKVVEESKNKREE